MEIRFNVTGAERKNLVVATSLIVGCDAMYMKAPSFAYMVGNYTIDKNGTLIFDERVALDDVTTLLKELSGCGFVSDDSINLADTPAGDASVEATPDEAAPVADAHTTENIPDGDMQGEAAPVDEGTADEAPDRLVIEMPLEGFSVAALDNLEKLVASKAALIMKSIGADSLPIERESDRLRFPWFVAGASPEEVGAYTQLIHALCEMAKKQRRVTAKEKPADSEKFAFRCFLLRLGFIGSEYAAARKILLRNLSGDSSFKSGKRKDQAKDEAAPVAANTADSGAETGGDANADEGGSGADSAEKSGEERFYA